MEDAINLIRDERQRQCTSKGYDARHDDEYQHDEIPKAAACYALPIKERLRGVQSTHHHDGRTWLDVVWPWRQKYWKPTPDDRIRELVKAGALIVAEIERLQRASDGSEANADPEVELYYLQDGRSYVGNSVLWWAKDARGYVCDIRCAEVFTWEKVAKIVRGSGMDKPWMIWPKAYIDGCVSNHIDMQHLNDAMGINYERLKQETPSPPAPKSPPPPIEKQGRV